MRAKEINDQFNHLLHSKETLNEEGWIKSNKNAFKGIFFMYPFGPTRMIFFIFPTLIYACLLGVGSCNKQISRGVY